jgi:hypothetical protein
MKKFFTVTNLSHKRIAHNRHQKLRVDEVSESEFKSFLRAWKQSNLVRKFREQTEFGQLMED